MSAPCNQIELIWLMLLDLRKVPDLRVLLVEKFQSVLLVHGFGLTKVTPYRAVR